MKNERPTNDGKLRDAGLHNHDYHIYICLVLFTYRLGLRARFGNSNKGPRRSFVLARSWFVNTMAGIRGGRWARFVVTRHGWGRKEQGRVSPSVSSFRCVPWALEWSSLSFECVVALRDGGGWKEQRRNADFEMFVDSKHVLIDCVISGDR